MKIQVPARLHQSDRIGSAILFLSFVPLFFHHLVSNSTHCYDFKIRIIFKTLSDSSYMYLYRMWVCLRLVSPYLSLIHIYAKIEGSIVKAVLLRQTRPAAGRADAVLCIVKAENGAVTGMQLIVCLLYTSRCV